MNKKILIIDDEKYICSVLSDYLEDHGYDTLSALNLKEARDALGSAALPDLVILDVMLPDGDGMTFAKEMRSDPRLKDVPIILMSAYKTKSEDRVVGLEFGADDYINKPFDLKEMLLRIERLVKPKPVRVQTVQESLSSAQVGLEKTSLEEALRGIVSSPKSEPTESARSQLKDLSTIKEKEESLPTSVFFKRLWAQFISLILYPRRFLTETVSSIKFDFPLAVVIACALLYGAQLGFERRSVGAGVTGFFAVGIVVFSGIAIMAWLIQWVLGLKQRAVDFKPLFYGAGASLAPMVVAGFLGMIYVLLFNGKTLEFTFGPLLILVDQASARFAGFFLRRLDAFELWSLWIFSSFLAAHFSFNRKKVYAAAFGIWFVCVCVLGVVVGLFK